MNKASTIRRMECMGRWVNTAMQNRINMFFFLGSITLFIVTGLSIITSAAATIQLAIFMAVTILLLTITTVRLSNNLMYSRLTGVVSMNIDDFAAYHKLDYLSERSTVAALFQEEFISGLEQAHRKGYRRLRMTTHQWVVEQVVQNPRVTTCYEVRSKAAGVTKVPLEVMLLVSDSVRLDHAEAILSAATRKRNQYKVKLVRKR